MEHRTLTNAETARVMKKILSPSGNGWCKGTYTDVDNKHCLAGAWMCVPYDIMALAGNLSQETFDALARIIREQFPERVSVRCCSNDDIVAFNDHEATVYEDIVAVLEKLEAS